MIGYTDSPQAWELTRAMGRVLGANLTRAVVEGWLTRAELGQLVDTCAACTQKGACHDWLSQARARPCMPVFCPNTSVLEGLSTPH